MFTCSECGFTTKDSRKLYLSSRTGEWLCDNRPACKSRMLAKVNVTQSFRPCGCDDPQPLTLRCRCEQCQTCGGYTSWAHAESL